MSLIENEYPQQYKDHRLISKSVYQQNEFKLYCTGEAKKFPYTLWIIVFDFFLWIIVFDIVLISQRCTARI
jgi:hypothetical protein